MQAPLAIFVNSANQLIIKSYHALLRVNNATTGSRQVSLSGIAQNPSPVAFTEFEYQFPSIQDVANSTNVTGSSSAALNGGIGPMPTGGLKGTAVCQWQLKKGEPGPTPNQMSLGTDSSQTWQKSRLRFYSCLMSYFREPIRETGSTERVSWLVRWCAGEPSEW